MYSQFPISLKFEDDAEWWRFPYDPMISISGKNVVTQRQTLKHDTSLLYRGTVKESITQGDYEITISGFLQSDVEGRIPQTDLFQLRLFLESKKPVCIECDALIPFRINKLVFISWDFPFTPGIENQTFTLKAVSDDNFDLFV